MTSLYFKWVTNKGLQGLNVICYLNGREVWGRMDTSIGMVESICYSPETVKTLLISYTPVQNKMFKKKRAGLCNILFVSFTGQCDFCTFCLIPSKI